MAERESLFQFVPTSLGPQKDERGYFISYGSWAAPLGLPSMEWNINDEDAFNSDTDEDAFNSDTDRFDARKIRAVCPACEREQASLCSSHTRLLDSDWRWVGCDHREPYSRFVTLCRCGTTFLFTTFTPQ